MVGGPKKAQHHRDGETVEILVEASVKTFPGFDLAN